MVFTYDLTTTPIPELTKVRFHIGDTTSATALFQDDEIAMVISLAGSWQKAVIQCIQNIIARMNSDLDFTADMLEVDRDSMRKHWLQLLVDKRKELGVLGQLEQLVTTTKHLWRGDSFQDEEPDF